MKDVTGFELEVGHYVALASNVSTSSLHIIFGRVLSVKENSARVCIQNFNSYYNECTELTINDGSQILWVSADVVPDYIKVIIDA